MKSLFELSTAPGVVKLLLLTEHKLITDVVLNNDRIMNVYNQYPPLDSVPVLSVT